MVEGASERMHATGDHEGGLRRIREVYKHWRLRRRVTTHPVYVCSWQTACGQNSLEGVDGDGAAASSIDGIKGLYVQSRYLRVSYRIPSASAFD